MEKEYDNLIAVVGMSGRFPKAGSVDLLWKNLLAGCDCLDFFSGEELTENGIPLEEAEAENYVGAKGIIDTPNGFDAAFFDYSVKESLIMDPQARVFLEEAWRAVEDSGNPISSFSGRVGVYAGTGMNTYLLRIMREGFPENYDDFDIMLGSDKDLLPIRVSYKLNLTGPGVLVQSTCSSSLAAVHIACQGLLAGDCDMALAGGVSISYPIKQGYKYRKGMIFSKSGKCRPFDVHSDGTVFSDGVGVVVLKRLEDALEDRDDIYGVIRGTAINNDGNHKAGFTAPSPVGQAAVIRDCLAVADVPVESIQYIETHGTATEIGDLLEIQALTNVYGGLTAKRNFCALGSIKSNLGHLNTASGIAGLIKTLLVLKHKMIPPMAGFTRENEALGLAESQFYINRDIKPLKGDGIARAAVSSFGIGGTNVHAILEEAPSIPDSTREEKPCYLFPFSAKSKKSLFMNMEAVADWLERTGDLCLGNAAATLQGGREFFSVRKAVVAKNKKDLICKLRQNAGEEKSVKSESGPVYFLISGQGSQYVHMARGLYEQIPMIKEVIDKGLGILKENYHKNFFDILYPDKEQGKTDDGLIHETENAQPLLFLVSYALGRYLMSLGIHPQKMIGHSLGEYVGACLAGVMTFEDGLDLVYQRGVYLQSAQRGRMLGLRASLEEIEELNLDQVFVSAINAPETNVIGGSLQAVTEAEDILKSHHILFSPLHTSHAFHTPLMEKAAEAFEEYLQKVPLKDPEIPILSNVTGEETAPGLLSSPSYWKQHIVSPVCFSKGIQTLLQGENAVFVEIGSGRTLIELAKQQGIKKEHVFFDMLPGPHGREEQYEHFLKKLSGLWELKIPVDFSSCAPSLYRKLHMPAYCFDRQEFSLLESQSLPVKSEKEDEKKRKVSMNMDFNRENVTASYAEPRDEIEELLLDLLKENLGFGNVGVFDNFFELGLSSLSASQFALMIKETIHLEVEIKEIIEAGCVANLSEIVADKLLEDTNESFIM